MRFVERATPEGRTGARSRSDEQGRRTCESEGLARAKRARFARIRVSFSSSRPCQRPPANILFRKTMTKSFWSMIEYSRRPAHNFRKLSAEKKSAAGFGRCSAKVCASAERLHVIMMQNNKLPSVSSAMRCMQGGIFRAGSQSQITLSCAAGRACCPSEKRAGEVSLSVCVRHLRRRRCHHTCVPSSRFRSEEVR